MFNKSRIFLVPRRRLCYLLVVNYLLHFVHTARILFSLFLPCFWLQRHIWNDSYQSDEDVLPFITSDPI